MVSTKGVRSFRYWLRCLAIGLGVYFGLLAGRALSQSPEGAMGTLPAPPAVKMSGQSYIGRATLSNGNEGIAEDPEIAYIAITIEGTDGHGYGVVLGGDRDLDIVRFLENARIRSKKIRIVLEELN
jgi:hypothetical protein